MGVKLLDKSWIDSVQVRVGALFKCGTSRRPLADLSSVTAVQSGQTCCLMRLVLRFYIERVFGNYPSLQSQERRCCSALANAFIAIRSGIHKCVSASRQPAA